MIKKIIHVLKCHIYNFNTKWMVLVSHLPALRYEKAERKYYLMNRKRVIQARRDLREGELLPFEHILDTERKDMYSTKRERKNIIRDFIHCFKTYGIVSEEYFALDFHNRTPQERDCCVTRWRQFHIVHSLNPAKYQYLVTDKALFVKNMSSYIGRSVLDMSNATYEEFCQVFEKNQKLMVKPIDGQSGKGIYPIETHAANKEEVYKSLKGQPVLVEDYIVQTGVLHDLCPNCVNTLRVATLNDGTEQIVPFAFFRTGRIGAVVDNLHAGGILWPVDERTGTVSAPGYDTEGLEHTAHPDSGIPVVGMQIPRWEEACNLVKEAAKKIPELRFLSWDVVIGDDTLLIIEANDSGGFWRPCRKDYNMWQYMKEYMDRTLGEDRPMGYF